jgi:hypothetical protein
MGDEEGASKMGVSGGGTSLEVMWVDFPFMPIVLGVPDGLPGHFGAWKRYRSIGKHAQQLGHVINLEVLVSNFRRRFFFGLVFCGKPWLFEELM